MNIFNTALIFVLLICSQKCVRAEVHEDCKKPADSGVCFMLFLAWYYDETAQECKEFIYRGCGGNENKFATEEECYKRCSEKLIKLEPPQNITVGAIMSDRVYLFWFHPDTYWIHGNITDDTDTGFNWVDIVYDNDTTAGHATEKDFLPPKSNSIDSGGINSPGTGGKQSSDGQTDSGSETTAAPKTDTAVTKASSDNTNSTQDNTTSSETSTDNNDESTTQTSDTNNNDVESSAQKSNSSQSENTTPKPGESNGAASDGVTGEEGNHAHLSGVVGSLVHMIDGSTVNATEYEGKTTVPFHLAKLESYLVYVVNASAGGAHVYNITVDKGKTEVELLDLLPQQRYEATVYAVYKTKTQVAGRTQIFTTLQDPKQNGRCYCDPYGTKGGLKQCNLTLGQFCQCKKDRAGLFCELCAHGYYRTAPLLPCHKCPCDLEASYGSCDFMEGYLRCLTCKEPYAGNLCHRCANGYYRDQKTRKCIKCAGCHNINPGLVCDPFTGECKNCHYNTTGRRCDRCLPGFDGDPMKNIPCTPVLGANASKSGFQPPAAGTIVAIVLGIIVLLCGVAAFIVYKRRHNFPAHKPFWTIEFKEDHEDVNFSAVPEDELERQQQQEEDLTFYDDPKDKKKKKNLPPYSQLREDC